MASMPPLIDGRKRPTLQSESSGFVAQTSSAERELFRLHVFTWEQIVLTLSRLVNCSNGTFLSCRRSFRAQIASIMIDCVLAADIK
jgi:hypothetical protein